MATRFFLRISGGGLSGGVAGGGPGGGAAGVGGSSQNSPRPPAIAGWARRASDASFSANQEISAGFLTGGTRHAGAKGGGTHGNAIYCAYCGRSSVGVRGVGWPG